MPSSTIKRKDFLVITVSAVAASVLSAACGDDPATPGGTGGTGTAGTGTAGTGTAGTGTAGTGTAGTGTAGTGTAGTGTAGTGTAGTGTGGASGGTGGASGGSAGAGGKGGSGGASGGTGGGGGSGGGGGGGMCGTVGTLMHTSNNQHTHIPADSAALKASLKTLINGTAANAASMEFTLPSDGQGGGHVHKIKLSAQEVATLKGGGTVTKVTTFDTMQGETTHTTNHVHEYTIGCTA